jgi:phosphoesterase RecJ-like protein
MQAIIKKINEANNIGVFTHLNADPDALGSTSAFIHVLKQLNKTYTVFLNENVEEAFEFFDIDNISLVPTSTEFDLLVSLDASSLNRLGVFSEQFENHANTIAIDHHAYRDAFGKIEHVEHLSSNCEIMLKLFKQMPVNITPHIATYLYAGLIGDTNCFRNGSTSAQSHDAAKELLLFGADFEIINRALFSSRQFSDFEILKRVIERAEFTNHIAISYITAKDNIELKREGFITGELVDILGTLKQVEISVLLKQTEGKNYRISLRSSKKYNIAAFAEKFGGGGHKQAAGMSLVGSLSQVKRLLLKELENFEKSND